MKFSFITTLKHNIGDDFVREGLTDILATVRPGATFTSVHKHAPVTATYGLGGVRSPNLSRAFDPVARLARAPNRINEADVVVQSGAPVYWCHADGPHCADVEWFAPLVLHRYERSRAGKRLLNLGGGSCQTYHPVATYRAPCDRCMAYMQRFYDLCDLTLLRDRLAQELLARAGRHADVLPCPSIFARDRLGIEPAAGAYIVLNFMERGGHFTFGQLIDAAAWRQSFGALVDAAQKMGRVVLSCHTKEEYRLAGEVAPDAERFLVPDDHIEFMRFYSKASFGVVNRVHAAFMMASLGKPAAVVGSDSRALMVENLGLPHRFVSDVDGSAACQLLEEVACRASSYRAEIETIRRTARQVYLDRVATALA
jgi:hypothetical protein